MMRNNGRKNFNHDRTQQNILIILCNTLRDEIYDPVVKLATFTGIKLTNDYSEARVYVDTYDRKNVDQVVNALTKAKGVFKTALANQLEIRKIPELIFESDVSIDRSLEVEKLLHEIEQNK